MAPRTVLVALAALAALALTGAAAIGPRTGALGRRAARAALLVPRDDGPNLTALYPAYTLQVPIDHFPNEPRYAPHSNGTFALRYWFDATHYRPGGPVFVLDSGEIPGPDRLPYLYKGIIAQLAAATHGLGVVLEHRYYGESYVTATVSAHDLRFLTLDQAVADVAYFAQNVVFPGLEAYDLRAPKSPWIAYGGSYAGAVVAVLRMTYPDVIWGAISSSGVTQAIDDYWAYFEAARLFSPPGCAEAQQQAVHVLDAIMLSGNATAKQQLKDLLGLGNVTNDADFANAVTFTATTLQLANWDPAVTYDTYDVFCVNVTAEGLMQPEMAAARPAADAVLAAAGEPANASATTRFLNWVGWNLATVVAAWRDSNETQPEYFSEQGLNFTADGLNETWRLWDWQVCTEFGFFLTGNVPPPQRPLVSRLNTLEYQSAFCRAEFNRTARPDTNAVNKYGGWDIAYPRLALIGGQRDPWRQATPLAIGRPVRPDTVEQPFWLIEGGVHHWDENGVLPQEKRPAVPPPAVVEVQAKEAAFVKSWLDEWAKLKGGQD